MRYFKKAKEWRASNLRIKVLPNHGDIEAYSYNWMCFVKRIKGKLVFNNYKYSVSTSCQQSKTHSFICRQYGYKEFDCYVQCPNGLQDLSSGIKYCNDEIANLTEYNKKPRVRADTKAYNCNRIEEYKQQIKLLEYLMS